MFLLVIKFKMIGMLLNVVHGQVQKSQQKHEQKSFTGLVTIQITMVSLHLNFTLLAMSRLE